MREHSVEKIGGTSMNDYVAIRDNIIKKPVRSDTLYQRIFVVSAYGGITDALLEHKKTGNSGVYALFANSIDSDDWQQALDAVKTEMFKINTTLFANGEPGADGLLDEANQFLDERIEDARSVLINLQKLCQHGHFALETQLATVREMLSSIGEAHSAWNTAALLRRDHINACFVDLTGWQTGDHVPLDQRIETALADLDLNNQMPIVTGYAHSESGLMSSFDRGYSEMTFSRIAVLTQAKETVIHKEFHLSSADPRLVGEDMLYRLAAPTMMLLISLQTSVWKRFTPMQQKAFAIATSLCVLKIPLSLNMRAHSSPVIMLAKPPVLKLLPDAKAYSH